MDGERSDSRTSELAAIGLFTILVGVLLAGGCYFGSYYLLVNSPRDVFSSRPDKPTYRIPGRVPYYLFFPANKFDRWLRPSHWRYYRAEASILLLDRKLYRLSSSPVNKSLEGYSPGTTGEGQCSLSD